MDAFTTDSIIAASWIISGIFAFFILTCYMWTHHRDHAYDNVHQGISLFALSALAGPGAIVVLFVAALSAGFHRSLLDALNVQQPLRPRKDYQLIQEDDFAINAAMRIW